MFNKFDVLETIEMIEKEHLDIRTVTMGISLLSCIRATAKETAQAVRHTVLKKAEHLVKTAEDLSREFGIPIVNKRVSVTPVSLITAAFPAQSGLVARALDDAANELGIDFLGGYSALVHKGTADYEQIFLNTIPEVLATTVRLCSSVNVGSSRSGINMDAVSLMGGIVKETAALTANADGIGCAKLVVFCNAVEDNPFMAGAFHGTGEADTVVNVGVSGPGVVQHALKFVPEADLTDAAEVIKRTAFKITRAGQLVAKEAAKRLGARFGIVDLSLAPTPARGDSVAHILEELGLSVVGCHGTTAALAMIAIRGYTPASTISAIIADDAAMGIINNNTTAVRVIPAPNKKVGDEVSFGGLLGRAPVMPVHGGDSSKFIQRGGLIPAPIHSFKN